MVRQSSAVARRAPLARRRISGRCFDAQLHVHMQRLARRQSA
jgi:hypothetical protein